MRIGSLGERLAEGLRVAGEGGTHARRQSDLGLSARIAATA